MRRLGHLDDVVDPCGVVTPLAKDDDGCFGQAEKGVASLSAQLTALGRGAADRGGLWGAFERATTGG